MSGSSKEKPTLKDLDGVGPTLQGRLKESGYSSLKKLTKAQPEEVAEVKGISKSKAEDLIAQAKKLVPKPKKERKKPKKKEPSLSDISGVGPTLEERLIDGGYKNLNDLAQAEAGEIATKVDGISENRAEEMISAAQDMIPEKAKKPSPPKETEVPEEAGPEIDTKPEVDERIWRIAKKKKQRKPKFRHNQAHRWKRVDDSWRRVRGIDSDIREKKKGHIKMPSAGFRTPKEVRGLHPSGYEEVLVHRPADLEELDPTRQAVRIGGTVGERKRQNIIQKADAMMLRVLNPGVEEAIIEEELFEELEGLEDIEVE
ncbi:MAG: 50S ribosomal protein L32e [Candidatus Thorarchaeota archaeon]|nr:50S ribosomal protein L32e [Candidatus Thorarchaeota archaeon]